LWELVTAFERSPSDLPDLEAAAIWLDDFAARHWDLRAGHERQALRRQSSTEVEPLVLAVARRYGLLRRASEPAGTYDDVLVLGGTVRACFARMALTHKLLESEVTCHAVTGLAAFRRLSSDEVEMASRLFTHEPATEFDALVASAQAVFAPDSDPRLAPLGDHVEARFTELPCELAVLGVSAGERRARTDDTYRVWMHLSPWRQDAPRRILLTTSQIYVPYQHLEALRTVSVPFGWYVDTVGTQPGEFLPDDFGPPLSVSHYLQEIRAIVHAIRRLLIELANVGRERP